MEAARQGGYNTVMLKVGVGQSLHPSPEKAAREAARMALGRAGLKRADLAIVFASAAYYPNYPLLLETIRKETGTLQQVGCSALGILTQDGEWEARTAVGVMVLSCDAGAASTFLIPSLQADPEAAGLDLGRRAGEENPPGVENSTLAVVFPDTYAFQPKPFFNGVRLAAGDLPIVGGGASEDGSLMQTFQFYEDRFYSDAVSGFILQGGLTHSIALTQACRPVGDPMMVTRAEQNTIFELAGRPALEWYSGLFSKLSPEEVRSATGMIFVGFPADPAESRFTRGSYLVRNVVGVDPQQGSLTIPDTVTEGQVISFVLREPRSALLDMEAAFSEAAALHPERPPRFALYFNCCGRGRSLYGASGVDPGVIKKYFGEIPLLGFFTYAEIAPIHRAPRYLNYSGVLVLIGETPEK